MHPSTQCAWLASSLRVLGWAALGSLLPVDCMAVLLLCGLFFVASGSRFMEWDELVAQQMCPVALACVGKSYGEGTDGGPSCDVRCSGGCCSLTMLWGWKMGIVGAQCGVTSWLV